MVVDPNNIYGADKKGIFDCIFKKRTRAQIVFDLWCNSTNYQHFTT